jgi:hypothetical protein
VLLKESSGAEMTAVELAEGESDQQG